VLIDRAGQVWTGVECHSDEDISLCLRTLPDSEGRLWMRIHVFLNLEDGTTFDVSEAEHSTFELPDRHRVA